MAKAKPGDILYFKSNQAIGYSSRDKIHVLLGSTADYRAPYPIAFLFISSSDYGGCFSIKKSDYPFLDYDSFISCGELKFYTIDYLRSIDIEAKGPIRDDDVKALRTHLVGHDVMPDWQISLTCNILDKLT